MILSRENPPCSVQRVILSAKGSESKEPGLEILDMMGSGGEEISMKKFEKSRDLDLRWKGRKEGVVLYKSRQPL